MAANVPTVNDLRVKLCYICREEELYDSGKYQSPAREWTHPCQCTLIAHEECLLKWIQSSQGSTIFFANALKCPQCGSHYDIESRDSVVLHILSGGNKLLQKLGRLVTSLSVATAVGFVGSGFYVLVTGYGAWAIRQFIGEEMFNILLTSDPTKWPWIAYFNLPLVTCSLLMYRFGSGHVVRSIIPPLLAWPMQSPVGESRDLFNQYWLEVENARTLSFMPVLSWPPSPMLFSLFMFPVARALYRALYKMVYHKLLGAYPVQQKGNEQLGVHINAGAFRIRIHTNVQAIREQNPPQAGPGEAEQQQQPQVGGNHEQQEDNEEDAALLDPEAAAVLAARQAIEINSTSVGRRLAGALLVPAVASAMGHLLLRLSRYSSCLRQILAVGRHASGHPFPLPPFGRYSTEAEWRSIGFWRQLGLTFRIAGSRCWSGTKMWAECDPVWLRNSIGLGLFIVARDSLYLLHLWLAKRELQSRRIKNRNFAGVDIRELDLIPGVLRI